MYNNNQSKKKDKSAQQSIRTLANSEIKIATLNLFNYIEPPNACYEFERIYTSVQWLKKQQWTSLPPIINVIPWKMKNILKLVIICRFLSCDEFVCQDCKGNDKYEDK